MTFYDETVTLAAKRVAAQAIADLLASAGKRKAIVVTAPAGAGKSHLVSEVVEAVHSRKFRVAVATPTNEQAHGLLRTVAARMPKEQVTFLHAAGREAPEGIGTISNIRQVQRADHLTPADRVVVGTLDKLGDSYARYGYTSDVLLIDEAYQADSSRYYGVAHVAPTHFLVGDSGQLNPFSTIDDPDRWRGLAEDPLQTAVGVLLRNHSDRTPLHKLPITRRLDPRAVPVARVFYPTLQFEAAVLPGVRQLKLGPVKGAAARERVLDESLGLAASDGWVHLELPPEPVVSADPEIIDLLVSLVARLFGRQPQTRCERAPHASILRPERVAVGVSHNDQKDLLRMRLMAAGYPGVAVETANKLQGLEFDVVFAWHPLAGMTEADGFHLDPGRLCVLLTRHRHACIVVGREGDRALLESVPPKTPAFLGWDPDPVLDGWDVHEGVFEALAIFRHQAGGR